MEIKMSIWNTGETITEIEGYNGKYFISNKGRVFSRSFNRSGIVFPLKQQKHNKGKGKENRFDYRVCLIDDNGKRKQHYIHRLVGKAFIPNPHNKPQIDHMDGNPLNNHVSNLRWCTNKENQEFRYNKEVVV
ncbi:NUMOD4 motif-containing HNH endonuclease [Neobacillus pocheonensis]|uniref:NUMOD4 motif-containing HNH endonuclease n=1 Tax=Neobacillus pocheonensis TaxID=363869 RepID=A0ABT0W7S5_9BACI|nr:NUMOD4 motif-containing HNH endonuclease [Neobacillus pocheonensis]